MKLLRYLALMFIDGFGITHPSIEARDDVRECSWKNIIIENLVANSHTFMAYFLSFWNSH